MKSPLVPVAVVVSLLTGAGFGGHRSTVSSQPVGVGILAAVDVPAPRFSVSGESVRLGGQAARIELGDASFGAALSAWYRLAYVPDGTRLQFFEHYPATTLGDGSDMAISEMVAWRLANQAVGPYGGSSTSPQVPVWARVRTGNNTGPSAGLMFSLAYVDLLTPGMLIGDLRVAGTGTIDADGQVGSVKDIEVKVAAATLARPDVIFIPKPAILTQQVTVVESQHGPKPPAGYTLGDWLNVAGYEQAGRDAAGDPGTAALVVVHDLRQALAWLCGRTRTTLTCEIAHRAASIPVSVGPA